MPDPDSGVARTAGGRAGVGVCVWGEEGGGGEGEGGAGGATLANRMRPWRGGGSGVLFLVNRSGVKLETSFGLSFSLSSFPLPSFSSGHSPNSASVP